jgi:hypothetical protein
VFPPVQSVCLVSSSPVSLSCILQSSQSVVFPPVQSVCLFPFVIVFGSVGSKCPSASGAVHPSLLFQKLDQLEQLERIQRSKHQCYPLDSQSLDHLVSSFSVQFSLSSRPGTTLCCVLFFAHHLQRNRFRQSHSEQLSVAIPKSPHRPSTWGVSHQKTLQSWIPAVLPRVSSTARVPVVRGNSTPGQHNTS